MLPLDMRAATLKVEQKQKALRDYMDGGGRDAKKAAELIGEINQAMATLLAVLTKFSEGSSPVQ
jgi:hypothetical protein